MRRIKGYALQVTQVKEVSIAAVELSDIPTQRGPVLAVCAANLPDAFQDLLMPGTISDELSWLDDHIQDGFADCIRKIGILSLHELRTIVHGTIRVYQVEGFEDGETRITNNWAEAKRLLNVAAENHDDPEIPLLTISAEDGNELANLDATQLPIIDWFDFERLP